MKSAIAYFLDVQTRHEVLLRRAVLIIPPATALSLPKSCPGQPLPFSLLALAHALHCLFRSFPVPFSPFSLKKLEQKVIEEALQKSLNVEAAAQMLGIARSTLYRKIKEGTKKLPENPAAWER